MNKIQEAIYENLPINKHMNSSGWWRFNCPCCFPHGESRPDSRGRGNCTFTDSGFSYHCYNCGFSVRWELGSPITRKVEDLMNCLNIPQNEINELKILALKNNGLQSNNNIDIKTFTKFNKIPLPENSKKILDLIREGYTDSNFIDVVKYIVNRNKEILNWSDFYYCNDDFNKRRFIIPGCFQNEIWGYSSRTIDSNINAKYIKMFPKGFIFNLNCTKKNRKYIIVNEGILDALSIDGIGLMTNTISPQQLLMLNSVRGDKELILLPDRDEPGDKLIDVALENNWSVSFPNWDYDIKDAEEAVRKYGRLFTLDMIIRNKTSNKTMINVKRKSWIK